MSVKKLSVLLGVLVVVSMILTACPAPQPQVVEKIVTQVVEKEVKVVETQVVEKQGSREDRDPASRGREGSCGRRLHHPAPDPQRHQGAPGHRALHQPR